MTEERADSVINGGPPALSLPAEVLLLSIDPAEGGLLPHRRRRLRKALGLASRGSADAGPGSGGTAIEELEAAGIAARRGLRRRLEVIDRRAAGASWRRLTAAISAGEEPGVRDGELILLLAWTGVLSHRLSRYERRLAARHLRRPERTASRSPGFGEPGTAAHSPLTAWATSAGSASAGWPQSLPRSSVRAP